MKQAGNVIVYTNRLSKRQMLGYDNEVEWTTEWGVVLRRLEELYGEDASVAVYPSAKLQFDAERNPLDV